MRPLLAALLLLSSAGAVAEEPAKDGMGRDYWLYPPKRVEPTRTYWLVVGVHGMGGTGRGAGGIASWATRRDDCLVVGPTFPSDGYQFLLKDSDRQLIELAAALAKRHRLHPKAYLVGFSGGAQFVHRFAHAHPGRVVGYAAHSAGSWSTGGAWGDPNPAAKALTAYAMPNGATPGQTTNVSMNPCLIDAHRLMMHGLRLMQPEYESYNHPQSPTLS